jgi:hypothetical protein
MRFIGLLGFVFFGVIAVGFVQPKSIEIHGLRPGMLTREIVLNAHAQLDTMMWGGANGASMIHFRGEFLKDSGEFRVSVEGPDVKQVLFVSQQRDTTKTRLAFDKMHAALAKLYGPAEEYHNSYHIWTWQKPGQQMKLSTMDRGQFYSIVLVEHGSPLVPAPDNEMPPK